MIIIVYIFDSIQHVVSVWSWFLSYACNQKQVQIKAWTRTRFAFEIDKYKTRYC